MKTANRARKNSGQKTPAAQSANTTEKTPSETPKETLALYLRFGTADTDIAEIALPDDLASYIQDEAAIESPDLGAFIIRAVRERIIRDDLTPPIVSLESAVQQALVMLDSAHSKLMSENIEKMDGRSLEFDQRVCDTLCGYQARFYETAKELHRAYQAALDYMQPKCAARKEAA